MTEMNDIMLSGQTMPMPQPCAPPPVVQRSPVALLLERWGTALIVSVLTTGAMLGAILAMVRPTYEVSAAIHVAPMVRPILEGDSDSDRRGNYVQYLGTEAANVVGTAVIEAAVNKPEVRALPTIAAAIDPIASLQQEIKVAPVRGTELVSISMSGKDPTALAVVVNAVLDTYMSRRETRKREWDARVLGSLKTEQTELQARLRAKAAQLRESAIDRGLGRADDSGTLIEQWMADLQQLLTQTNKDRAISAAHLALLDAEGQEEDSRSLDAGFEGYAASDPELLGLREQIRAVELSALSDANLGRGPSHPDVRNRPALIEALRERIEARETGLRDAFSATQRRELEAELQALEISARVYEQELAKLDTKRVESAGRQFVLDDLQHERQQIEESLAKVREKIWNVEIEQNRAARVTIASYARVPSAPNVDKRMKLSAAAILLGLFTGVGAALLRGRLDNKFRSPIDVTQRLGVRVLGSIQDIPEGVAINGEVDARLSEPIRGISTSLLAQAPNEMPHTRLITSPTAASGKSSLAVNLARSLAATGRRVLLVDADNHGQGLSRRLGMQDRPGLAELLDDRATVEETLQGRDLPNLKILPAGERCEHFGDILSERRAQVRLRSLFDGYDEIIVDSPPVLAKSDAVVLATLVDEVILVLRAGTSTAAEGFAAQQHLASVGANVVGVVLNGVDPKNLRYGYNYTYAGTYTGGSE